MGEITYIVIDEKEKRISIGGQLDEFVASLAKNPATIDSFNQIYNEIAGEFFYDNGNRPKVPEELSLDTIRKVLGLNEEKDTPEKVEEYWIRVSAYKDPDYKSYKPDEKTERDIPELTQEIIDEWKKTDPEAKEFPTANDYRKLWCNDGIVVADLRKKELRYISRTFNIHRRKPTKNDIKYDLHHIAYTLPRKWKIVVE